MHGQKNIKKVEIQLQISLNWALDEYEWSAAHPAHI